MKNIKNWINANMISLLGSSWRTTLAGYAQFFVVCLYHGYIALNGKPVVLNDVIQIVVSAIFALALRAAKDKHIDISQDAADATKAKVISAIDSAIVKPVVVVVPPKAL